MVFKISFYMALIVFGIGLSYKVLMWFRCRVGLEAEGIGAGTRFIQALKGIASSFFSVKFLTLVKTGVLDVFLQRRIAREGLVRWVMHAGIAFGFLFLLLMHALDRFVTQKLFAEYFSTLNPFLFLRNLFGALMLIGLALAAYRRIFNRVMRLTTGRADVYALAVLGLIVLSGFFLEATKIVSHQRYEEMVTEFSSVSDEGEAQALRAFWARDFGVVFPQRPSVEPGVIKKGEEVHVLNCASCHSRPASAFVSYGLAKAISPVALTLSQEGIRTSLRYIHFLVCFLGLALLPFTKFFHILTTPLVLLINEVLDRSKASAANLATVRAIELDACTHCATCSLHCSVGPVYRHIPNIQIWPSEKLIGLTSLAAKGEKELPVLPMLREGNSICTRCYRCTSLCPAGIVLQDLWFGLDRTLTHLGCPEPFSLMRETYKAGFDDDKEKIILPLTPPAKRFKQEVHHSYQDGTFNSCFECVTCSNACPVVVQYKNPGQELGLLPHQIMHSLKLGLEEKVLGAGMVWDCLGCYNCQQSCPQGIRVTDILFELKNIAFQKARKEKVS
jgi:heterodisulfide reductase subunit C/nitrate reductase gamma subunit